MNRWYLDRLLSFEDMNWQLLLLIILGIGVTFFRIWSYLMYTNVEFNDDENDLADSRSYLEYWIRKCKKFWTKK